MSKVHEQNVNCFDCRVYADLLPCCSSHTRCQLVMITVWISEIWCYCPLIISRIQILLSFSFLTLLVCVWERSRLRSLNNSMKMDFFFLLCFFKCHNLLMEIGSTFVRVGLNSNRLPGGQAYSPHLQAFCQVWESSLQMCFSPIFFSLLWSADF